MKLTLTLLAIFCYMSLAFGWAIQNELEDELDDDFDDEMELEERHWKNGWKNKKNTRENRTREYEEFRKKLADGTVQLIEPNGGQYNTIKNRIHSRYWNVLDFGPESIRLAFHDCVGGNCDGCLDLNDPNNKGLERVVKHMDGLMRQKAIFQYFSRADLYAFAAVTTLKYAVKVNNAICNGTDPELDPCPKMPQIPIPKFVWGRKDCGPEANVPRPNDKFVTATMTKEEQLKYFKDVFNMDSESAIVLVGGVHALGGAHRDRSGYEGKFRVPKSDQPRWASRRSALNNGHFRRLVNGAHEFRVEAKSPNDPVDKKFQFNIFNDKNERIGMMLPSDVRMAFNIDGTSTEPTTCKLNDKGPVGDLCPKADTYNLVEKYSTHGEGDLEAFAEKLGKAFSQMINIGHPKL